MVDKETRDDAIDVQAAPDVALHDSDDIEELEGSGIAAKTLTVIAILMAGGALALWAGPKIAPKLPSGMAPIANWLSPGGAQYEGEIAALKAALANIPEQTSLNEIEAIVAQNIDAMSNAQNTQIAALSDQIAAADSGDVEARIAQLETSTEGLRAELSSLMAQLSEVSVTGGEVSDATAAQIATYAASMDGLKAEIAKLAAQNGALSQKIDNVTVTAERQVVEAETKASEVEISAEQDRMASEIRNSLSVIDVALAAGLPFGPALDQLETAGVVEIPDALTSASGGVTTMAALRADFPDAAHSAIRASILASSGDGIFASISAFTRAQVAGRSLTPQEGLGPDAVLSRVDAALKLDDLATAMSEIDALPAVSISTEAAAMNVWVANASARLQAVEAYESLVLSLESE